MAKLKSKTGKCSQCGQKLPGMDPPTPKPMSIESRFKRGKSSITKTLRLIEDQRGRTAAKAALAELQEALKWD